MDIELNTWKIFDTTLLNLFVAISSHFSIFLQERRKSQINLRLIYLENVTWDQNKMEFLLSDANTDKNQLWKSNKMYILYCYYYFNRG